MIKKYLYLAFSLSAMFILCDSCTSEKEFPIDNRDLYGSGAIHITVNTPSPDDITGTRASVSDEEEEHDIQKLSIYLFLADQENRDDDNNYILRFKDLDLVPGSSDLTEGSAGSLSYVIPITPSWIGKQAKVALIANDKISNTNLDNSTWADIKMSLASASLNNDGQQADVISGNIYAADPSAVTVSGLPMTALAKTDSDAESFTITPIGAELSASLQRIVARIDVCNFTPNLTITDMSVNRAAAKAYLFSQSSTAAPVEIYYTLKPTGKYTTLLQSGIHYTDPATGDAKTANTHKQVFYLYEQNNSQDASAEVVINYSLNIGQTEKEGTVTVPLKTYDTYINTTRNYLYTVVLGNGKPVEDILDVTTLTVNDWEQTVGISGGLNPSDNSGKPLEDAEIGDFYMNDGTLRDGKSDLTEDEKKNVIGIVFLTYKEAPERLGTTEIETLKDLGVTTPHGLVLAVKNAKFCNWRNFYSTSELDILPSVMTDLSTAISDNYVSGLYNWNIIKDKDNTFSKYPAFKAVAEFGKPAPATSTGWFLPSIGQWWDILMNMSGMEEYLMNAKEPSSTIYLDQCIFNFSNHPVSKKPDLSDPRNLWLGNDFDKTFPPRNINSFMSSLGDHADKIDISSDMQSFHSSSESGANAQWCVGLPTSKRTTMTFSTANKYQGYCYVRAILAF